MSRALPWLARQIIILEYMAIVKSANLKDRILSTLRFFDLQDQPLTLQELHWFLIADWQELKPRLDSQSEITNIEGESEKISIDEILRCLETECHGFVQNSRSFYHLPGRAEIVDIRLNGYFYGIEREKLIKKYARGLRHIPFVRGAALAGSQAMGRQKDSSDIDLFIITDPRYMWLARTLVTAYFQILGKRRHGNSIANRFCLNHYVAGAKKITQLRNLYTAYEYAKLRPLVYDPAIISFQNQNQDWLKSFFPNLSFEQEEKVPQSAGQKFFEKFFSGGFGRFVERALKSWQLPKIHQQKFIVVEEDELSFHPDSKQQQLLADFTQFQQQQQRVAVKLVV